MAEVSERQTVLTIGLREISVLVVGGTLEAAMWTQMEGVPRWLINAHILVAAPLLLSLFVRTKLHWFKWVQALLVLAYLITIGDILSYSKEFHNWLWNTLMVSGPHWPWLGAIFVGSILLGVGFSIGFLYFRREINLRKWERHKLTEGFLAEINKLTPVIHWAFWRAKDMQGPGLLVTEVLQQRLKEGLILRADNATLGVTPQTDPAPGKYKHLDINYSYGTQGPITIKRWENTEFALPVDPWLRDQMQKAEKEWARPLDWTTVFKIQRMKADPVSTDPNITFKNKLRFDLTNITGKEIYVWMPLWDSGLVPSQADPTGSRLLLERTEGSWQSGQWVQMKDGKNLEHCCVKLRENATFESFVGLNPNAQDSVDGLLKRNGTIGSILFPVKIDGKMYEIRVPASEVSG